MTANLDLTPSLPPLWQAAFSRVEAQSATLLSALLSSPRVEKAEGTWSYEYSEGRALWLVRNDLERPERHRVIAKSRQDAIPHKLGAEPEISGDYWFTEHLCWCPNNDVLRVSTTVELTTRMVELVDAFGVAQTNRALLTFTVGTTDEQTAEADAQVARIAMQIAQDLYDKAFDLRPEAVPLPYQCSVCHYELDTMPDGAPGSCPECDD